MPILTADKIVDQVIRGRSRIFLTAESVKLENSLGEEIPLHPGARQEILDEIVHRGLFPDYRYEMLKDFDQSVIFGDGTKLGWHFRKKNSSVTRRLWSAANVESIHRSPMNEVVEEFMKSTQCEIKANETQITFKSSSGNLSIFPIKFVPELEKALSLKFSFMSLPDQKIPSLSQMFRFKLEYEFDGSVIMEFVPKVGQKDYVFLKRT